MQRIRCSTNTSVIASDDVGACVWQDEQFQLNTRKRSHTLPLLWRNEEEEEERRITQKEKKKKNEEKEKKKKKKKKNEKKKKKENKKKIDWLIDCFKSSWP